MAERCIRSTHVQESLQRFRQRDAETPLRVWYAEASRADWQTPADIKAAYRNAKFNIKGNAYRLVVAVHYDRGQMFARFIGSHRQCGKINVETI